MKDIKGTNGDFKQVIMEAVAGNDFHYKGIQSSANVQAMLSKSEKEQILDNAFSFEVLTSSESEFPVIYRQGFFKSDKYKFNTINNQYHLKLFFNDGSCKQTRFTIESYNAHELDILTSEQLTESEETKWLDDHADVHKSGWAF